MKQCEKCGEAFDCGAAAAAKSCWCQDHKLSGNQLEDLRKQYNDCLCPKCLTAMQVSGL